MKILSSAKVNLNLTINNEIIDGLHTLSTLMTPIDLFDKIEIYEIDSPADIIEFIPQIEIHGDSTIHKALHALREVNNFDQRFHIKVHKYIPVEAGLGGGSSNAGTIIKYLSERYSLEVPKLSIVAKTIGSDVPFFIKGSAAKVNGFGEQIIAVDIENPLHFLLATPHETLSTKKVFESFDEQDNNLEIDTKLYKELEIKNNLWHAAVDVEPKLQERKEHLEGVTGSEFFMSGSGTTLFSFGEEEQLKNNIQKIDLSLFRLVTVTKKIDSSLLREAD